MIGREGIIQSIKVGVSGSAVIADKESARKAELIGYHLARAGAIVVTGDTTGIPDEAAKGAKKAGGFTLGVSPAHNFHDHVRRYKLPYRYTDFAIYTGFGYSGRNLLFIRATDAVIFVHGRIGTLNEFTIAFEDKKPIGILTDSGGISDELDHLLTVAHRGRNLIVFDDNPKRLVEKVLKMAKADINRIARGANG